jgi:hypothetical protein
MPRRIVFVAVLCLGLGLVVGGIMLARTREALGYALVGTGALTAVIALGVRG